MPFDDQGNWYNDGTETDGNYGAPPVQVPGTTDQWETPIGSGGSGYLPPVPVAPPSNGAARQRLFDMLKPSSVVEANWFLSVTTEYTSVAGLNAAYMDAYNRIKKAAGKAPPVVSDGGSDTSGASDEVSMLKQRVAELEQAVRQAGVAVSRDSQHKLIIGSGTSSEYKGLEGEYSTWALNPPFVLVKDFTEGAVNQMLGGERGYQGVPSDLWTALKTQIPPAGWPTFGKVTYAEAFLQDTGRKPMEIVTIIKNLLGIGVALAVHESTKSFQMGHLAKGAVDAILAGGKATYNGTWAPYASDNGVPLLASALEIPDGLPNEIFEDYRYVCFDFVTGNFWPTDEIKAVVDDGAPHRWQCLDRMDGRMYYADIIKKPRISLDV